MAYIRFYNPYDSAFRDQNNDAAYENLKGRFAQANDCDCQQMRANISETENLYQIEIALPGVDKSQINVKHENGLLQIKVNEEEKNGEEYRHREFNYKGASRVFKTGDKVDVENINARYENGILTISLPKKEAYIKKPVQQIAVV
jgi:HSP20 family protein